MEQTKKIILKEAGKKTLRKCGHPFQPTFDVYVTINEGLEVTSYCVYCMMEKIGLEPCAKSIVPRNIKDPSQIKYIFNK